MKRIMLLAIVLISVASVRAQQYTGMSGLIHVPSAEMDTVGEARIGAHFLNGKFTPDHPYWEFDGKKYNTCDFYLSLTPFKWMEIGYTITLFKHKSTGEGDKTGYNRKDRYVSIKFRPLEEGRYWPAVAIGANDFLTSSPLKGNDIGNTNGFWRNYYLALTKHFGFGGHEIAPTVCYRYFPSGYDRRWRGVVGGVTYRPAFAKNWRAIVEWTGCDVNAGIDCIPWKHLLVQASLQNGRWPSAGLCYMVNLF